MEANTVLHRRPFGVFSKGSMEDYSFREHRWKVGMLTSHYHTNKLSRHFSNPIEVLATTFQKF
jgi:hypothetical protein